jgi:hypothetical protein
VDTTITAQLSEEAQEAVQFLEGKNIDVNRTINRLLMRVAQEEGWHISLVPVAKSAHGNTGGEHTSSDGEPTVLKRQQGNENTPMVQSGDAVRSADLPPIPAEKPFVPGVVLAYTMADQDDIPQRSSVVKKMDSEEVA